MADDSTPPDGSDVPQDAPTEATTDTQPQGDPPAEPPAWFREYTERQDKTLKEMRREHAKLRRKLTSAGEDDPPSGDPAKGKDTVSPSDMRSEMAAAARWGTLSAQLPADARKEVQAEIDEGGSFADAVKKAELIQKYASRGTNKVPKDEARGGDRGSKGSHPESYAEWQTLGVKAHAGDAVAKARYEKLLADPEFLESFRSLK